MLWLVFFCSSLILGQSTQRSPGDQGKVEAAAILSSIDVATMDFKNLTILYGKRIFAFKDGNALNYDGPSVLGKPDWKAEFERDIVVQPTPGVFVRFLLIHDSHETGSGWRYYLVGYICSNGRLQEVFHRDGLSLRVERLDSSGVTVTLNTVPGKDVTTHWSYTWDRQRSTYELSSTWSKF